VPTITCLTDHYACAEFNLAEGESIEVSDEKAAQLTEDFPDWFKVEKPAGRARTTDASAAPRTTDSSVKRARKKSPESTE